MNESGNDCVLFFAKYPEKGKVKKRLALHLGEDTTLELYRHFVLDSLSTLERCGFKLLVCVFPPESQKRFSAWLGMHHAYVPQRGEDLGQRMKSCFVHAFHCGFQSVVAVGSDIPDLPGALIQEAVSSLAAHDAVIGPSIDGGYYLIGFKKNTFIPEVFDGIDWGTHTVCHDTRVVLQTEKCHVHTLPEWRDVDTLSDLKHLVDRNRHTAYRHSGTLSYLSTMDGWRM